VNADEVRERSSLNMNPQRNGTGKDYWRPINFQPVTGDEGDDKIPPAPPSKPFKPNGKPNGAFHQ